jgi:hypothetical protein
MVPIHKLVAQPPGLYFLVIGSAARVVVQLGDGVCCVAVRSYRLLNRVLWDAHVELQVVEGLLLADVASLESGHLYTAVCCPHDAHSSSTTRLVVHFQLWGHWFSVVSQQDGSCVVGWSYDAVATLYPGQCHRLGVID